MSSAPSLSPENTPGAAGAATSTRSGIAYGAGSYLLWGMLPLYFLILEPAGPVEIVSVRILFALLFCLLLTAVTRGWSRLGGLLRDGRTMLTMLGAAALIFVNWFVYILAATSGHVVEAALGYFINPIVTVLLGVLLLRERLRALQWAGIGIALVAVLVLAVGYGSVPWISLALAFSFGFYGLLKRRVGGAVDAVSGLTVETAWLTPLALVLVVVLAVRGELTLFSEGLGHLGVLALAGPVTAVPLLLFAAGARRLPLVAIGFLQFFAPILQFLLGVLVLHEEMPPERLAGFMLIWLAVICIMADAVRGARVAAKQRASASASASSGTGRDAEPGA